MAVPNSSHPYKIYITTQPHNFFKDDQSLESPLIKFKCNIKINYVPDKLPDKSNIKTAAFWGKRQNDAESQIKPFITGHDSWHEFEHPAKELTRNFLSTTMFSSTRFPFELTNLHWKQIKIRDEDAVPIMSTDELVTSMLQVCHGMISDEARKSPNPKKLNLIVSVRKVVTVPYEEYLAMLKAEKQQELLEQVAAMVRYGRRGNSNIRVPRQEWQDMTAAIREAGLGNSIRDALDLMRRRAMWESAGEVIRVAPAAAKSIQALEKVTLMSNGIDDYNTEDIKCIFCLEEMAEGCEVTRMPCSHIFHGPCIEKWLKERSHMCPICRFKLATDDS